MGYDTTDNNGKAVEQWPDCDLTLIHDAKPHKSFNSAICKKGINPDFFYRHKHTTYALRNTHTSHTRAPTAPRLTIQTETQNPLNKHTTLQD